jgi:membrane associated rhomboid family serine protease
MFSKSVTRRAAASAKTQVTVLGGSIAVMWGVFALNSALGGALLGLGVIPRTEIGLRGILFGPFLHANLNHLVANTVPFLVLGWLVMLRDAKLFFPVTFLAALGAGLTAWLLGAPGSDHIGASGVIMGYLGFLMLTGWFTRSIGTILLSAAVTFLWGGLILAVLPGAAGISWQEHLGGFLGGVLAARLFRGAAGIRRRT